MRVFFIVLSLVYYVILIVYPHLSPQSLRTPVRGKIVVAIPYGVGAKVVVDILYKKGVTKYPNVVLSLIKQEGVDRRIRAGGYVFGKGLSAWDIVRVLEKGRVSLYKVSIPEGLTALQIANALSKFGIKPVDFMYCVAHKNLFKFEFSRYIRGSSLEGFLFPDTYLFPAGFSAKDLVEMMLRQFEKKAGKLLQRVKNSRWGIYDRVIIASIIEKEALLPEEKPIMASVFFNRLRIGRRLESCATVEYVLPKHKQRLTLKDLKVDSPYNTYIHKGLPPTPICNPGIDSIKAAVNPAKTKYLYFVLQKGGKHHFSATYKEHLRYKLKYERRK